MVTLKTVISEHQKETNCSMVCRSKTIWPTACATNLPGGYLGHSDKLYRTFQPTLLIILNEPYWSFGRPMCGNIMLGKAGKTHGKWLHQKRGQLIEAHVLAACRHCFTKQSIDANLTTQRCASWIEDEHNRISWILLALVDQMECQKSKKSWKVYRE